MVRTIYLQISPEEAHAQLDRVVEQPREPFPVESAMLEDVGPDILALTGFPMSYWQKLWSNNSLERLNKNKEIRWRTNVVGIFPNRAATRRLFGAVLAEQHDEGAEGRCHLTIPNESGIDTLPEPRVPQAAD